MANDITGIDSARISQSNSRTSQRTKNEAATTSPLPDKTTKQHSDKITLTDTAARLKDLERNLSDQPPVNAQRVNDVKAAIANGSYEVDADRVADKMIDFETTLHR